MTWKNAFKRSQFESGAQLEARHIVKLPDELISHRFRHDLSTFKQAVGQSAQTPNLSNTLIKYFIIGRVILNCYKK